MESTYIGIGEIKRRIEEAMREALEVSGEEFKAEVVAIEPERTGAMIASTEIGPITGSEARLKRKLTVGAHYGIWQHQKAWYHHSHGRAKYVVAPLMAFGPRLRATLAEACRRRL